MTEELKSAKTSELLAIVLANQFHHLEALLKKPQPGDAFFREFEQDLQDLRDEGEEDRVHWATITEVGREIEDQDGVTSWSVTCDDEIGYDCFWSEPCKAWVYGLGNGYHPAKPKKQ